MHLTYPASILYPDHLSDDKAYEFVMSLAALFDAYSLKANTLERKLYVDWIIKQGDINLLKRTYQQKYDVNARHFNSIRISLKGKVESILKLNKGYIEDSNDNIGKLKTALSDKEEHLKVVRTNPPTTVPCKNPLLTFNSKRYYQTAKEYDAYVKQQNKGLTSIHKRLADAQAQLDRQLEIERTGNPQLCFGSKKLWHQQFNLDATSQTNVPNIPVNKHIKKVRGQNNKKKTRHAKKFLNIKSKKKTTTKSPFKSHAEWKEAWRSSRNRTFMLVGSKDEKAGNSNCQLVHLLNNTFQVKVNLDPSATCIMDRYTTFTIEVHHGVDYLIQCLNAKQAVSVRFYKEANGLYRLLISLDRSQQAPDMISMPKDMGVVGIDINEAHISVAETDRFGNLTHRFDVPCDCRHKTTEQAKHIISGTIKTIIQHAVKESKAIVVEDLDFSVKKKSLKAGIHKKYNAMLSSFAYQKIIFAINARALDKGIEVISVNPAYSSVIGRYKYQGHRKLTTHQAAAYVIARRGMYSIIEEIKKKDITVKKTTLNNEKPLAPHLQCHYAFNIPVRNDETHGFHFWKAVRTVERQYLAKMKRNKKRKNQPHGVKPPDSSKRISPP